MKLNGWQRLWVVVVMVGLLPVVALTYMFWQTATANVAPGDVYLRMKPEEGRPLVGYLDCEEEAHSINQLDLPDDKDFLAAAPEDQKAYLAYALRGEPTFTKLSPLDRNACIANIIYFESGRSGPVIDTGRYELRFAPDVSLEDQRKTVAAFDAALRRIVLSKRSVFVAKAFASWLTAGVALYALGWAIAWVRRGFGARPAAPV